MTQTQSKTAPGGKTDPKKCAPPSDEFATKLDMCLTDAVVKSGSGVILGALTSSLFFRRRRWPIICGMGIGIGLAWANCENALNPPKTTSAPAQPNPS